MLKNVLGPGIPRSAQVFGWLLVFAGSFFAYVYLFDPGSFFPGVSIETHSERFGLYSTGVRILGSVVGIMIALLLDSAALLCLMFATRVFIELGDVVVGLVTNGGPDQNTVILLGLAAVEVGFVIFLLRVLTGPRRNPLFE